jgi:hypothetical protein
MNNERNNGYTSRTERRKIEEELEKRNAAKEKELEVKRQELKSIIFDDSPSKKQKKENVYKRELPKNNQTNFDEETPKKKPTIVNIILSLTMVITLAFSSYLIYDSFNQVDQVYQIINAIFIFITILVFLIAFKRAYHYKKTKAIILTAICLIALMGFNGLVLANVISLPKQSSIPDFSNKTLTEAIEWAEANNIKYEQNFEYSDNISKYNIINQDVKSKTLTKNIDKINFEVSNGPDYNKEVLISNMEGWNIDEAVKVIDENFLNNVTVNFEENKEVTRDTIMEQSNSGNMKRNDAITFKVSLGDKEALKPITLKELKNMTLFKATLYLNRNAIDYELKYEFSDKIAKGKVISSSIKKGTKVSPGDKITLTISKGKKIIVPELKNMKMSKVTKWMVENNLKINYSDKYDNEIKSGHVIEATYKKGDIIEEETTIGIVVSKGKLKMPKFNNITDFKAWADKYKIKYEIKEEFNNDIKKGDIIKFSVETNKTINPDEGIIVYVSKGKAIEVPNFIGKTKSEIQKTCNQLGINCTFVNEYSNTVKEGNAISQSIKSGEKISKGDSIQISIATKNKNNVSKPSTNNSNNKPSGGSSNGSSNNSSGNNSTPKCKQSSYTIGRDLNNIFNAGGNFSSTKNALESYFANKLPGVTLIVKEDSSSNASSGSYISGVRPGSTISCPSTVTIVLAK